MENLPTLRMCKKEPNLRPDDWSVINKLPKFHKKIGYCKISLFDRGDIRVWFSDFVSDSYNNAG